MEENRKTADIYSETDIYSEIRRLEAELPEGQYLGVLTDEEKEVLDLYNMLLAYQRFYVIHYLMDVTDTAADISAALLPPNSK